jgi:predicted extracellular nuclease
LRIGDTATGITGVLGFGFSNYRLQPTTAITFAPTNPRPAAPEAVGGDVKVASFNTLNYFTTLTTENSNARGANSAAEFARQQVKEVEAITGIDSDVVGLMEVENNGTEAIGSLVDALNADTAPGTYAYITEPAINAPNEFGGTFGTDAIKVALIYRPAAVTPVGPAQTSTDPVFDRPPLIQTFERTGGSEAFKVVVNHFKSKNCAAGSDPLDTDQGDGQSCFNNRRVLQAQALDDALDTLAPPNTLIIGDLNSYTEEDPIHALEDEGYTGLSEVFIDDASRYSFVFNLRGVKRRFLAYTFPPRSPHPRRLAVPTRHGFVRAACHPSRHLPRQAAPSFTAPLRRDGGEGLSPPLNQQAPHGAPAN